MFFIPLKVYNVSSATLTSYTIHSDYDEIDLHNNEQTMDERSSHQRLENLDEKTKKTLLLSKVRSLVIVLALSIHSIFEGMAVGKLYKNIFSCKKNFGLLLTVLTTTMIISLNSHKLIKRGIFTYKWSLFISDFLS